MTKSMVMVFILGAISKNIPDGGTKVNNMVWVYLYQEKVPSKNSESGKKEKKFVGLIKMRSIQLNQDNLKTLEKYL
jgi:hypothetical protein